MILLLIAPWLVACFISPSLTPDITFAVHCLSQFMHGPTDIHLQAAHKILKYIKNNPGQGLFYSASSELCLNAFTDADYATFPDTKCSITGYCVYLGNSLITWKSKKQGCCEQK